MTRSCIKLQTLLLTILLSWGPSPGSVSADGERLLLFAYGDTRPNFWPFGSQRKHRAVAEAMVALDEAEGREADGVLATGDFIFADVPLTDKDWRPAWEAMQVLTGAPHPLKVRPVQGNHEMHAVKGIDVGEELAPLAGAILEWGAGQTPDHASFDPVALASAVRLADSKILSFLREKHMLPTKLESLTPERLGELRDQLGPELQDRLGPGDRQRLEQWSGDLRVLIEEGKVRVQRLKAVQKHVRATIDHLHALTLIAEKGNKGAAPGWLAHTRLAGDGGISKSWRLLRDTLMKPLGPAMTSGTSLEGVDQNASTGPSWYRFDHPIPGGKSLRVIGLNTNLSHVARGGDGGPADPLAFLVSSVKEHDGPILLFGHHPVITAGHHGEGWKKNEEELITATRDMIFVTLRSKVSPAEFDRIWAFIAGHDHDYERFIDRKDGRVFLVAGGGGVPLRNRGVPEKDVPEMCRVIGGKMGAELESSPLPPWRKAYHFVAVEVGPDTMDLKVYGIVENPDDPLSDEELAARLTPAILEQRQDPTRLIDHVTLRQRPGAPGRTVEVAGRQD